MPRSLTPAHRPAAPAIAPTAALAILAAAAPSWAQGDGTQATSVFEMFFLPGNTLGLLITWLLIVMSICVVALIIRHVMENRASVVIPPENVNAYQQMLQAKRFRDAVRHADDDRTMFGRIMNASLSEAANGYGAMERAIEEEADLIASERIRSVELLSVIGAVGPMIGLFGTVYGMIVAFQAIVEQGGSPNPSDLAGGISTALVTTFWGLIVGIPAVAAAALIRNKIDGQMVEAMIQAEMLISPLSPTARKSPAGPAGASPQPKAAASSS